MNYLVFEPSTSGHRLEYYHHLYSRATELPENNYIFVVDSEFEKIKNRFNWPSAQNVQIHILNQKESKFSINPLKTAWQKTILLHKLLRQYNVDKVFLIELLYNMPFSAILISLLFPHVKISGIVCLIYTYRWNKYNFFKKILYGSIYRMMAKWNCFEKVFLLNDYSAVCYLNKLFKSNHFHYLGDPIAPVTLTNDIDIRAKYNISEDKILLCQFGGLGGIKGTDQCLKAFLHLPIQQRKRFACIFAGRVFDTDLLEYQKLINEIGDTMQVILVNEFCSYNYIGNMCKASDFVLLTYRKTECSSGVLGIAAQFKTPVIAPNANLLGKLVKKNKLGFVIDSISSENIANFLLNIPSPKEYGFESYVNSNTIQSFKNTIF